MVRPGRESFKRFIKTIIEQLPAHIEEYPPADQYLLMEFLSVLQHYEEADYQRTKLSQRLIEYNERVIGTKKYLNTAFLWFIESYFSTANILLNVSTFHANSFYEYLTKYLRGSSTTPGVYGLVRESIPLTDLAWEQLQYSCDKLLVPLTNVQLRILKTIFSFITEDGVYALDPRKLKAVIVKNVVFPKKNKPSEELTRFFTLMDGRWFFLFFSPAFGLNRLVFQFQLQESTSLEDVIDFRNPANTVLTVSDVYSFRKVPNNYIAILLVPTEDIDRLESYLQNCERQGYIILRELSKITTVRKCISLNHYQENIGWIELSPTKLRRLTQLLQSKNPKKRQREKNSFFITPEFNLQWYYSQHQLPKEIIKLYCKNPPEYSYSNLPLRLIDNQDSNRLSRTEVGLLKQLHYNHQVVQIGFVPWRLVYDFSLDLHCIILHKIPFFQLERFLNLIPFSEIYSGEKSIYIWARLTPKLVKWIKNDLKWTVISIIRKQYPLNLDFKWFNVSRLKWKIPNLLKE